MSQNEIIIEDKNSPYNGMNIHSTKFAKKVIREVIQANNMKLSDGKTDLINAKSPKWAVSQTNKNVGSVVDWANSTVDGNIIFFLLNHQGSKVFEDPEGLGELLGLSADYVKTLSEKKMGINSKYSKSSIINEVVPTWFYDRLKKAAKIDTTYFAGRGISQKVVEEEGVLDLSNLTIDELENALGGKEDIVSMFMRQFDYVEKFEYSKQKKEGKSTYLKSKISILEDFIINLDLDEKTTANIKQSLFNLYKKIDLLNKTNEYKIKDNDDLEEHLAKLAKIDTWFDDYQPQTLETMLEFNRWIPYYTYKDNKRYVQTIACRTAEKREDGQRYVQIGKTAVEEDYKQNSEYLFVIEGKADKKALKTFLRLIGISEKSSIVTFMNAKSTLPYGVIKKLNENKNLKIVNMLDNDNAGKAATEKIFSKLYEKGYIENVYDFGKFIEDQNIDNNDVNDFLQNENLGVAKFTEFIKNISSTQRKIINKDIRQDKDVVYLKNTSELKRLLDMNELGAKGVYLKIKNDVYALNDHMSSLKSFYNKNKENMDFKNHMIEYILNSGIPKANVLFLEKGKTYHHEILKNKDKKVYLIENPNSDIKYKGIYSLPQKLVEKDNGEVVDEYIERFLYDGVETAEQMACSRKKSQKAFVQDDFKEAENFENFSEWWIKGNEEGIASRDWTDEKLREKNEKSYKHELGLIKKVYEKYSTEEEKREYLVYFLKLNKIIKRMRSLGFHNGVRGSAMNFVSLTNMGWTDVPQNIFEYVLQNKEVMFSERFMNPTKKEMADVDVEYGKNGDTIKEILHSEGLFVPIVVKKLGVANVNLGKGTLSNNKLQLEAGVEINVKKSSLKLLKNYKNEFYFEEDGFIWHMDDNDKIHNLGKGVVKENHIEMTELKTEIGGLEDSQSEVYENENGQKYYIDQEGDVRKIDIEYEFQVNLHPCAYTMVPEEMRQYFTNGTTSLKFTVDELEAMGVKLKYDFLYQKIGRPSNLEGIETIKLSDVLFKDLPQISNGAQKVLVNRKNIEFPNLKTRFMKYFVKEDGEEKPKFKTFYAGEGTAWIDEVTGEAMSEEDIKAKYSENGNRLDFLAYPKEESIFEIIEKKYNSIDINFVNKYFPKEAAKITKILNQDVTLEEMMIAASTFRPSFSGTIYVVNEKIYKNKEDEQGNVNLIDVNTGETYPKNEMCSKMKKELGIEYDAGKTIEVEVKYDKNNKPYKNLTFSGYTKPELESLKRLSSIMNKINVHANGNAYLNVWSNNLGEFNLLMESSPALKNNVVNVVEFKKELIYENLNEQKAKRAFFDFLNLSNGFILFQEQMYSFIIEISEKYIEYTDLGERENEFLNSWKTYGETIRKFSSKAENKITQEVIYEAEQIFSKLKVALERIEKFNPEYVKEANDIIENQFFILKSGAYLYNMGHAVYVAMNAMQEAIHRRSPERFKVIEQGIEIYKEMILRKTIKGNKVEVVYLLQENSDKGLEYREIMENGSLGDTIIIEDNEVNEENRLKIIRYNDTKTETEVVVKPISNIIIKEDEVNISLSKAKKTEKPVEEVKGKHP